MACWQYEFKFSCGLGGGEKETVFVLLFSFQPAFISSLTVNRHINHDSYASETENIFSFIIKPYGLVVKTTCFGVNCI